MPNPGSACFLSPRADADLEQIWIYSAETWSTTQADKYVLEIVSVFDDVCRDPDRGDDISKLRDGYRLWRVASHFIIYRRSDRGIDIVRILHQRQDIIRHV